MEAALSDQAQRPYARAEDYELCRSLHRRHGTTYYFASRLFPAPVRRRTDALYGFVRMPDEWVDNPDCELSETRKRLEIFREELLAGVGGVCPQNPVLRAFCDVAIECKIPLEEPVCFLRSMEQDLDVARYETFEDLCGYMRGSAGSVGVMMCSILSGSVDENALPHAEALGEAMQLTNFLRDVGEDANRGRIYLPLEELRRFRVSEEQIFEKRVTPEFKRLMRFEVERARNLYGFADSGLGYLPSFAQKAVGLASELYSRILGRIEAADYDVFRRRARTSRTEKLLSAARVLLT